LILLKLEDTGARTKLVTWCLIFCNCLWKCIPQFLSHLSDRHAGLCGHLPHMTWKASPIPAKGSLFFKLEKFVEIEYFLSHITPSPAQVCSDEFSTSYFWIVVGYVLNFVNHLSNFSNYDHFLHGFSSHAHASCFYDIMAWLSQGLLRISDQCLPLKTNFNNRRSISATLKTLSFQHFLLLTEFHVGLYHMNFTL
jgi:hypothetical protein